MRQISLLNICVDINNALTIFVVAAASIAFWLTGEVSVGSVAVAIGLAMRINGMSQWIMWEVSALFEAIGTVYDGMSMMTKPHDVTDTPAAPQLPAKKGHLPNAKVRSPTGQK